MVNKIKKRSEEEREEERVYFQFHIFQRSRLAFFPFSFLPASSSFRLEGMVLRRASSHRSIALMRTNGTQKRSDISAGTLWLLRVPKCLIDGSSEASDRKLCVSPSSAPEVTARHHTPITPLSACFVDCIFFRAPGKLPACLFFARSAIVEGLATISLVRGDEECPLRVSRLRR